jgi:hypothetical protein
MGMYIKEWAETFTEVHLSRYTEAELCEFKKIAKDSLGMYHVCLICGFVVGLVYFTSFLL